MASCIRNQSCIAPTTFVAVVLGSLAAITVIAVACISKTKTSSTTLSPEIKPSLTSPQPLLTMNKTAAVSNGIQTLAPTEALQSKVYPGQSFISRGFYTHEYFGPEGHGIIYKGRNFDMLYITDGPCAGRLVVRLPDGSVFIMRGHFVPIRGSVDAWRFVSDCPHQPLSIIIDYFHGVLAVAVR